MLKLPISNVTLAAGLASATVFAVSCFFAPWWLTAIFVTGLAGLFAWRYRKSGETLPTSLAELFAWRYGKPVETRPPEPATAPLPSPLLDVELCPTGDNPEDLVHSMLAQGRYALLLRPQITANLDKAQFDEALAALEDGTALVPGGAVVVGPVDEALDDGKLDEDALAEHHARLVPVEPVYLDRYPVTNGQFYQFVATGGYEDMAIWDEEIWPAVLDFTDATGEPGPKYWRDGRPLPGEAELPVVGVSWYEALAYSRWVGKRLPSDAEWVKAGCWPINHRPGVWLQRKYPWGNSFDHGRANIWGSGRRCAVSVHEFSEGVSVGGLHQLIGNVWEWTSTNFGQADDLALTLPVPMKSIRGGAHDTYFESQATCHFQSGENPLSRKHNIGFRPALCVCDLADEISGPLGARADHDAGGTQIEEVYA